MQVSAYPELTLPTVTSLKNPLWLLILSYLLNPNSRYLSEKGRIDRTTLTRLLSEVDSEDALLVEIAFDKSVAQAMPQVERSQVPDLPDRIIAATALSLQLPLVSRDRKIQMSSVETIW